MAARLIFDEIYKKTLALFCGHMEEFRPPTLNAAAFDASTLLSLRASSNPVLVRSPERKSSEAGRCCPSKRLSVQ